MWNDTSSSNICRHAKSTRWLNPKANVQASHRSMLKEEFASYAYLTVTVVGVALLCSGLLALALVTFRA